MNKKMDVFQLIFEYTTKCYTFSKMKKKMLFFQKVYQIFLSYYNNYFLSHQRTAVTP